MPQGAAAATSPMAAKVYRRLRISLSFFTGAVCPESHVKNAQRVATRIFTRAHPPKVDPFLPAKSRATCWPGTSKGQAMLPLLQPARQYRSVAHASGSGAGASMVAGQIEAIQPPAAEGPGAGAVIDPP